MKAEDVTTYSFNATYKRTLHGLTHSFQMKRLLKVEIPNEKIKTSFYDPNLKINVECLEILERDYEIEIADVAVNFEQEYRKTEDFYRRINYRYDWIILHTTENGRLDSVLNKDELRTNWRELSEIIKDDYIGEPTNNYLADIDSDFATNEHFLSLFNQYFYFGLLFPPIPYKHIPNWKTERDVFVWETHSIAMKETLKFVSKDGDIRNYRISGELLPNYPITLDECEGNIKYSSKGKIVKEAKLHLLYRNSGTNEWTFELQSLDNTTNQQK